MNKGLLIVVSGPSGAGKGTICKELLQRNREIDISISATTRQPRSGEAEGVNYFYISREQFLSMIDKNEFLEYAQVYGNFYGTPKKNVLQKLEEGKDVLLEIDIQGALKVKEIYSDGVFIFIMPPSMDELKNRIIKRGTESDDAIIERFNSAYNEMNFASEYNYGVINDELESAVQKIEAIVTAEKCKIVRQEEIIKRI